MIQVEIINPKTNRNHYVSVDYSVYWVDNGIGSYEYNGMKGHDKRIEPEIEINHIQLDGEKKHRVIKNIPDWMLIELENEITKCYIKDYKEI